MYRGTTPTLPIRIAGVDLTQAKLFLTIQDGKVESKQITLETPTDFTVTYDSEKNVTEGDVTLTQEQTMMLNEGSCKAQIRFVFADGQAGTTLIRSLSVNDVLLKDVISYDG